MLESLNHYTHFSTSTPSALNPLGQRLGLISQLIDWEEIRTKLQTIFHSGKGWYVFPPLLMFKTLLLADWFNLSYLELEEQLSDRLSFRKFCGLGMEMDAPNELKIYRFRHCLAIHGMEETLLETVHHQIRQKGFVIVKGTLVEASLIGTITNAPAEIH